MQINSIGNYSYSTAFHGRKNCAKDSHIGGDRCKEIRKSETEGRVAAIGLSAAAAILCLASGKLVLDSSPDNQAQKQFSKDPQTTAQDFIKDFKLDSIATDGSKTEAIMKPYSVQINNNAYPTSKSVIKYNFEENVLTSATLDIDGDEINEITVSIPKQGSGEKIQISYDYNDDGETDFVEDYTEN